MHVKTLSGCWVPATPVPGSILLNTGDLLENFSGGMFPATMHRVDLPCRQEREVARQSIAFFLQPDSAVVCKPVGRLKAVFCIVQQPQASNFLTGSRLSRMLRFNM